MTSKVTVGSDGGVQKTLTGKQADKVKAGVQRLLQRGDAAPIKPGQTMPSSGGRAPKKGGVEVVRGDVAIKASTELVRGSRLALAERVLGEMYSGTIKKGSKAARDLSNIEGMKRIVRAEPGGAQKTAKVLRQSVDKVLNEPKRPT